MFRRRFNFNFFILLGSHDLLYQEFLPLLPNLLQGRLTFYSLDIFTQIFLLALIESGLSIFNVMSHVVFSCTLDIPFDLLDSYSFFGHFSIDCN